MTTLSVPPATEEYVELTTVPRRHPLRWVSAVVLVGLGAYLLADVFTNPRFGWDVVNLYLRDVSIFHGLVTTLVLTVVCMAIGIALAVLLAVMRLSPNPVVRTFAFGYVSFFRGTPVLVQLLFWFNLAALYPVITFGIPGVHLDANTLITPFIAAVLGLGLNEAAYMSEIVRAGILSVSWGQTEAARALGLKGGLVMRRIVLPQALRVIVPPTTSQYLNLTKNSSLATVIGYPDLVAIGNTAANQTGRAVEAIAIYMAVYLTISLAISVGMNLYNRAIALKER